MIFYRSHLKFSVTFFIHIESKKPCSVKETVFFHNIFSNRPLRQYFQKCQQYVNFNKMPFQYETSCQRKPCVKTKKRVK